MARVEVSRAAADDLARPRIEQQLVRIEAVTMLGLVRAVRAQAIDQSGADTFDEAVEHAVGGAVQRVLLEFSGTARIEDAEFDLRRVVGKHGEVDTVVSGQRAERFGAAFLNAFGELHCLLLGLFGRARILRAMRCTWPRGVCLPEFRM